MGRRRYPPGPWLGQLLSHTDTVNSRYWFSVYFWYSPGLGQFIAAPAKAPEVPRVDVAWAMWICAVGGLQWRRVLVGMGRGRMKSSYGGSFGSARRVSASVMQRAEVGRAALLPSACLYVMNVILCLCLSQRHSRNECTCARPHAIISCVILQPAKAILRESM